MNLRHELVFFFFPSVQLNNLTNFKNKGEENNLYILFFLIISTKIKSNTRTKALQKKKLTYIKQVGLISLYYMSEQEILFSFFFFFLKRHKIKRQ